MREDLIAQWRGQKDLTHIFVTTFSIDLLFVESMLLRELRLCGHPRLTILADAEELSRSFAGQSKWLSQIGYRYRVVPIEMRRGYRFHPKLMLLTGREASRVYVGSGNAGFGGMRQNEELWTRFDSGTDGTGSMEAARLFLVRCLSFSRRPEPVLRELTDAFDPSASPWAAGDRSASGLLTKAGDGPPLIDTMAAEVGGRALQRIMIGSPYFDEAGDGIAAIADRWPGVPIEVLVPTERSTLTVGAWSRIREPKRLRTVESNRHGERSPFVHAKFYGFVGAEETLVFSGSANCTRAALLLPGSGGNAEVLAATRLANEAFVALIDSALRDSGTTVSLPEVLESSEADSTVPALRIMAAHLDGTTLTIEFATAEQVELRTALVDGVECDVPESERTGKRLRLQVVTTARRVELVGIRAGEVFRSPVHWVDSEAKLAATSHHRRTARTIGDSVTPSNWSIESWSELIRLLGEHVSMSNPSSITRVQAQGRAASVAPPSNLGDYLSTEYQLRGTARPHHAGGGIRLSWLAAALFELFGVEPESEQEAGDEPANDRDGDEQEKPNEHASRPHAPPPDPTKRSEPTAAERRRVESITRKVVERILAPDFVTLRPVALLGRDIALLALLLVKGRSEGWISSECFCELTHRAWTHLFLDDGRAVDQRASGAIARRRASGSAADDFDSMLATPSMTAALAVWALACPESGAPLDRARFRVARCLAVARTPWLFMPLDLDELEQAFGRIALGTGWLADDGTARWTEAIRAWNTILTQGQGLRRLEDALETISISDVASKDIDDWIAAGTLLWQGQRLGFCILAEETHRHSPSQASVRVQPFRPSQRETRVQPKSVKPFTAVLQTAARVRPGCLTDWCSKSLLSFAREVELAASSR